MSHVGSWAGAELAPWRRRGLTRSSVSDLIDSAVSRHGGMFRYDISRRQVVCSKPPTSLPLGVDPGIIRTVLDRAEAYRVLLERSHAFNRINDEFALAIDVSDMPISRPDLPLFTFQKETGSPCVLLPDVDLLWFSYLESPEFADPVNFIDKKNRAIFVGSTTGELLTKDRVASGRAPRLRAAAWFKNSAHVDFWLPTIVQCDSPETEAMLCAMELGGRPIDWRGRFEYRHFISIDGNGATCLRIAAALRSNSVLLKYNSPHQLFYFKGLVPWVHYVPIDHDGEIEDVVVDSEINTARYERIADDGRRFFHEHLRRAACERYVAALLRKYLWMLLDGEGLIRRGLPARVRYAAVTAATPAGRLLRKGVKAQRKPGGHHRAPTPPTV